MSIYSTKSNCHLCEQYKIGTANETWSCKLGLEPRLRNPNVSYAVGEILQPQDCICDEDLFEPP